MATRKPPAAYSARQLHDMLVRDVSKNRAPGGPGIEGLGWFTAAIIRIGEQTGRGAEQAMTDFLEACMAIGVRPDRIPTTRATPAELRRLGLA